MIHQQGVSLCNDNFTEIISNEVVFDESDQIKSEEDLSRVESVIGESYIICLIKKKILIFNAEGHNLYYNSYMEDINNNALYYSLVYYNKDATYAYFLIGYILEHVLHLDLYGYHMDTSQITVIHNYERTNAIENQGLSCHNMNYSYTSGVWPFQSTKYANVISCLYAATGNKIILEFFEIKDKYEIIISGSKSSQTILTDLGDNVIIIKGDLFNGNSSLLFGWLTEIGVPNYRLYNIETTNFNPENKKFTKSYCELKPYGFKIKYYPEKKEVMYTCLLKVMDGLNPKQIF